MTQLALDMRPRPRVLSYGGGADSFAVLLGAIERGEAPDAVAFVDVSNGNPEADPTDPGEWSGTYRHIREVVIPLCKRQGIAIEWIDTTRYPVRDARSLFAWMWARGQIPVAGPNRLCTTIAKVERFERWMSDVYPGRDVEVWIGFEAGEEDRVAKDPNAGKPTPSAVSQIGTVPGLTAESALLVDLFAAVVKRRRVKKVDPTAARRHNRFPLIEWGMCRCRAVALIQRLGYPVPRKSACKFCPYGSMSDWQTFAREDPEDFARVGELEARKPPTSRGHKLSIMAYRSHKDAEGKVIRVDAPPLAEYVQRKARPARKPCKVCGAAVKATKATGCGYLEDAAA